MECYLITATDNDPYDPPRTNTIGIPTDKEELTNILMHLKQADSDFLNPSRFSIEIKVFKVQANQYYSKYEGVDFDASRMPQEELLNLIKERTKNTPKNNKPK